jgi:hypothetical protein
LDDEEFGLGNSEVEKTTPDLVTVPSVVQALTSTPYTTVQTIKQVSAPGPSVTIPVTASIPSVAAASPALAPSVSSVTTTSTLLSKPSTTPLIPAAQEPTKTPATVTTQIDKKMQRAERFGLPISDEAKKAKRAERFHLTNASATASIPSPHVPSEAENLELEKLKARAARFNIPDATPAPIVAAAAVATEASLLEVCPCVLYNQILMSRVL